MVFPIGAPNDAFAQYFIGRSYLAPLSTTQVGIFNVTFEPGCRNNWRIHHADKGGSNEWLEPVDDAAYAAAAGAE